MGVFKSKYFDISSFISTTYGLENYFSSWEQLDNLIFTASCMDAIQSRCLVPLKILASYRAPTVSKVCYCPLHYSHKIACGVDFKPESGTYTDFKSVETTLLNIVTAGANTINHPDTCTQKDKVISETFPIDLCACCKSSLHDHAIVFFHLTFCNPRQIPTSRPKFEFADDVVINDP